MSKEDNCVLDDGELKIINHALEDYFNVCTNSDYKYDKLLKKINKLNDLETLAKTKDANKR